MSYTLIRKKTGKFRLTSLSEGQTISRNQYDYLCLDIACTHSVFAAPDNVNRRYMVTITRKYIEVSPPMKPRFVPCVEIEKVNFFVEGIETLR